MRAPVVIIGIGGIGSDICMRVEQMLPKDAPDRYAFQFVVMDTDVNTLREVRKGGFGGTIIQLSDNMTVAKCAESFKEKALSWYPKNGIFSNKPMTEGAGQYRAISRLAFEYAIHEEKLGELERIIRQLHELSIEDSDQQIRFYVINSLAGGTGSGIALPLVLYLNYFFIEEFGEANFSCKGFFLLSSSIKQLGSARLEQESVDANAYAAVKELSSYMRVADSREERYSVLNEGVEKNAGITDSMGYGKVYDYCFLFGMFNEKGRCVHSFEDLKSLVANAVYVQACSPLHDKNSSMEDNTIKHMIQSAQQRGENYLSRFGGIGCGELVYPYEKIKRYLALQWAADSIGNRWQEHDKVFYDLTRQQEEKRKQGKRAISIDHGEEYIRSVDNAKDDFLIDEIKEVCYPERKEATWKQFLRNMCDKISEEIDRYKERAAANIGTVIGKCEEQFSILKNLQKEKKTLTQARNQICELLGELKEQMADKCGRDETSYARMWFVVHDLGEKLEPYWLEYYLVYDGYFIHPGVVRYFLYQLKREIPSWIGREKDEKDKAEKILEKIENYNTKDNIYKKSRFSKAYRELSEVYNTTFEWSKHFICLNILNRCNEYVKNLCEKFENFYQMCDSMLDNFYQECDEIGDELDRKRGMASSYVCANKICRKKLFQEMQKDPYYMRAGKDFFNQVYLLVQSEEKGKISQKILYNNFSKYWIENIEKEFGNIINFDILKAIEKHEWYINNLHIDALGMTQWIQNVEEKLTNPFLQYMKEDNPHQSISLCCYNSELEQKDGLHREVVKWLRERRGVEDKYYCSPYQLIFYRSLVGLNASKIQEYLHKHTWDITLRRGKAFRAYEKNMLGMNVLGQSKITPHINKKWHNYLEMPDADREYQQEMELRIGVVFCYAIITKKIFGKTGEYKFCISESILKRDFKTYMECHKYLYENPYGVQQLTIDMLKKIKEERNIDTDNLKLMDKIKNWKRDDTDMDNPKATDKIGNEDERGVFQILIQYNEEVEPDKQDFYLNRILIDSLFILIALFTEGDENDIKRNWNDILSINIWKKCFELHKNSKRVKEIDDLVRGYVEENDALEVRNLCTQLFFTEMGMI